ncbi:MAG: type II secretion system F family protein [Dehalococcoidia bacterium]
MSYKYLAQSADGKIVKGTIGVMNEGMAEEALQNEGYTVLHLEAIKPRPSMGELFPSFLGIKSQDVIDFSRQLATLIESGMSLTTSLNLLREQVVKSSFRKVIAGLYEELQGGSSFSAALAKYPKAFPDIYCRIVGAGEKSGNLEDALRQAIRHMERGTSAAQKVKRIMIYPSILVVLGIVVVTLLITVALPPLLDMFDELDVNLPWTTRLLIAVTDFFSGYKFHVVGALIVMVVFILWYVKRPAGRLMLDRLFLRLPLLGPITILGNMALFSRTISVLMKAGLPLPQVMEIARQTTENKVIGHAIGEVQQGILQGRGLSKPMAMHKVFPPLLVQVAMVGEQTGTLDANLETIADFYEDELDRKISVLTSLIEPIMITALGLGVGFIALSVIMPMYQILGKIK